MALDAQAPTRIPEAITDVAMPARRLLLEALDGENLGVLDTILTDDFVDHSLPPGFPTTADGLRALIPQLKRSMPDARHTIDIELVDRDYVVLHCHGRGTNTGPLFGGEPPTGRSATWAETHIYRMRDGRSGAAATLGLLGAADGAASGDARLLGLEAAARMLRALAGNAGLLLVLDDVQWADSETLEVIDYLSDTLDGERVLCLLTIRSEEPGGAEQLVDRITVGARATRVIALDRLHEPAVDELARATLRAEAIPAGLAPILQARAEGLPLAAEQILADLVARHILTRAEDGRWTLGADTATTVPHGVRRLISRRLERLATTTRTVLSCAALLGRDFDWVLLEVATGFDRPAVLAALGEATAAQFLDGGESGSFAFRHALLRDGVLAALAPEERARLAGRTAAALEASSDSPPPEALELAGALRAEAGDRLAAAALLVRLGEDALRRGAFASAARTLARAFDLGRGDAALGAAAAELRADALTRAGHHHEAIEVIQLLIDLLDRANGDPVRRAQARLRLARAAIDARRFDVAGLALEQAGRAAPTDRAHLAAVASLQALLAMEMDDVAAARSQTITALAEAEGLLDAASSTTEGRRVADICCEALYVAARVCRVDQIEAAIPPLERVVALAELHQLPHWRMRSLLELGIVDSLTSGRVDRLQRVHDIAVETGALSIQTVTALVLASPLAGVGASRGAADMRAAGLEALELARRYRLLDAEVMALVMRAAAEAVIGDKSAVDGDDVADACARLRMAGLGSWMNRGLVAAAEAVCLARRGARADAQPLIVAARTDLAGHPVLLHLMHRLVAEAAAADGWGEPVVWLREACAFFGEQRMLALERACTRELRRLGESVPRRGRGDAEVPAGLRARGVTSREMDVLLLVRVGMANPEIAEQLCMSRRTVETHVSRLLAKTGAATRAALVAGR